MVRLELSDQTTQNVNETITLLRFIEQLIEDTKSGKRINPKTKQRFAPDSHKSYQNTLRALEIFEKNIKSKIDFDNIDLEFYNDFKAYMMSVEKVSNNYFGLHIKNIKLILNESFERGLHINQKHNHKLFMKMQNETDNICLNQSNLNTLSNLDLSSNARLDRLRDLFLVGCWTGLRFSDFNDISPRILLATLLKLKHRRRESVWLYQFMKL